MSCVIAQSLWQCHSKSAYYTDTMLSKLGDSEESLLA